jgi:hypothetical protein
MDRRYFKEYDVVINPELCMFGGIIYLFKEHNYNENKPKNTAGRGSCGQVERDLSRYRLG